VLLAASLLEIAVKALAVAALPVQLALLPVTEIPHEPLAPLPVLVTVYEV